MNPLYGLIFFGVAFFGFMVVVGGALNFNPPNPTQTQQERLTNG
jgi:hypothetical protein